MSCHIFLNASVFSRECKLRAPQSENSNNHHHINFGLCSISRAFLAASADGYSLHNKCSEERDFGFQTVVRRKAFLIITPGQGQHQIANSYIFFSPFILVFHVIFNPNAVAADCSRVCFLLRSSR